MNRDREALSQKLIDTRNRYLIAQPDKPDSAWAVLTECAEALALPPAGGVEGAIRIVRERQHYRFGLVDRNGKWATSEIVRVSGQGAGKDFSAVLERWLPALSPTTLGGEIRGRLAAKDGAAAPPQAPVAGSEPSASEVAE